MATLLDVRKKFVDLSGRIDLVVDATNYVDNGADWFIQAGQRFLDDRLDTANALAQVDTVLSAGDWFVDLANIRAVLGVRLVESGEGQFPLRKQSLTQLRERLGIDEDSIANADEGKPNYYALGVLRTDTVTQAAEQKVRLIFFPPSDAAYTLSVVGLLRSASLTVDASFSWWSLEYPDVLVKASLYQLENFYNNFEGTRNWLGAVDESLRGIDFNKVSEEVAEVNQMEDSW